MKKKELDLEKLGKVTGGNTLMDQCAEFQHAYGKSYEKVCENCTNYVEREGFKGKYYCSHPSHNQIAR